MALTLRFLSQASRQSSQIATATALTPRRALASGAVSARTPRSPRMSLGAAGEALPFFGGQEMDAKPASRPGSFIGGLDIARTPPGSFIGEGFNASSFVDRCQNVDIFRSFVEDEDAPFFGTQFTDDASTGAAGAAGAASSTRGQQSPLFGEVDNAGNFGTGEQAQACLRSPYDKAQPPMLLGRSSAHTTADVDAQELSGDQKPSAPEAIHLKLEVAAAQAARDVYLSRMARRSGRRLA